MKPYYSDEKNGITIYHGDWLCTSIAPGAGNRVQPAETLCSPKGLTAPPRGVPRG